MRTLYWPVIGLAVSLFAGQAVVLRHQLVVGFNVRRIQRNAVHGTDLLALGFVVVADTLGALVGINDIDLGARGNGLVRALRLADIAIDAVVGNHQRHGFTSENAWAGALLCRLSRA